MMARELFEELGFEFTKDEKKMVIQYRKSEIKSEFGENDVHIIVFHYGVSKHWFYALWVNIYDDEGNIIEKEYKVPLFYKELSDAIIKQLEELG